MRLSDERHRMPDVKCISCGKTLNAASAVDADGRPSPGDISVCVYCGKIMIYGKDMALRELTEIEKMEILRDMEMFDRIEAMQQAAKRLKPEARH